MSHATGPRFACDVPGTNPGCDRETYCDSRWSVDVDDVGVLVDVRVAVAAVSVIR